MQEERLEYYPCSNIEGLFDINGVDWNDKSAPLKSIAEHAFDRLEANGLIVQRKVWDPDYFAEFNTFHSKVFQENQRLCTRLHFIKQNFPVKTPILDVIDSLTPKDYLGFMTIRPVQASPVGATILVPVQGKNHFLLSKDSFEVTLAGKTFTVSGTPFMQQDNAVGACAQASIWMALRTMRKKEGRSAHSPAKITTLATKYVVRGRTLPNREGLNIEQMIEAVRSAGYAPSLLSLPKRIKKLKHQDKKLPKKRQQSVERRKVRLNKIRSILYPYVESGIPVILALEEKSEGHAVVLIGHGWDQNLDSSEHILDGKGNDDRFIKAVSWAKPFFIHNDNSGPYQELDPFSIEGNGYSLESAIYAIPLFPNGVYMDAEEGEIASNAAIKLVEQTAMAGYKDEYEGLGNDRIVLRTYLSNRHTFRKEAFESTICSKLKDFYRKMELPRKIWVTEINTFNNYGDRSAHQTSRLGEVIIDATGNPEDIPFLSVHLPGIFAIKKNLDNGYELDIELIKNDTPYQRRHRAT
ncbi:hypothetical protein D8Y20_12500 [Mariprofundus sp. EBB-1]|uniref:hypothetical protein n=1 Tax=Mariprofundus sp. EBB-1 TaxID=2650971 RepID=UPI000EF1AA0F|nr:hypothetical protein [Mariprofundus sp. EBB-1]RLL49806.1 hypothetical protein D8Y20_12500 [Mariprofundus sp. EBB-1]